jgi:hypothetical protein
MSANVTWLFRDKCLSFPYADMITLSSGEVINPTPIEERVKMHIPLVHYAVVVGQDSPYLCALLTMKVPTSAGLSGSPRVGSWVGAAVLLQDGETEAQR